nr:hypothetical protein [Achromobacter piechaudii]
MKFGFTGSEARFKRLAFGGLARELLTQGGFGLLGLLEHRGDGAIVILKLALQIDDVSLALGGALLQRALLGFEVVQAEAQRITLCVELAGALHQLPDSGGELV